ncbi:methyltransferase domain-containing protein [bacterium]|nr:methyltransferase domain-containing protein [candidate division CSSED10-310 bacterium]
MPERKPTETLRCKVKDHFESIAPDYDSYKQRSRYYHAQLKALLIELVPDHREIVILEIGCGTGALLAHLDPKAGLGVDIAENMVDLARKRWMDRSNLRFHVGDAETMADQEIVDYSNQWDAIIMSDVIEHLYDPGAAIASIAAVARPGTRVIITWANALWEPILHVLEALHMKMPEGEHKWEDRRTVSALLTHNGFGIEQEGTRCLIPADFPGADVVNRLFISIPGIRRLGLIQYIVAVRGR